MSLDYDPLGRLWETVSVSGTYRFQYDGAAIIAAYNASGVMQHRWVHGPGMDEPLVRYDGSAMTNRTWLHADERGLLRAKRSPGAFHCSSEASPTPTLPARAPRPTPTTPTATPARPTLACSSTPARYGSPTPGCIITKTAPITQSSDGSCRPTRSGTQGA